MKGGMKVHPMSALGVLMSDLVYICVVIPLVFVILVCFRSQ